ncbi:hypothetical protein [Luteimonas sp. 100069]|uniref:hypothetical protein n=1 Tax=Luteimonas sp. 100069 TaxID=2006109 RepID=UPI000F4FC652|nr:hypothetical protein [Luteimonas sp. 100069]RPD85793.1 hypothetical protein EGK76_08210 [Luteimonas sp. 100069]
MKTLIPEPIMASANAALPFEAPASGDILPGVRTIDSIAGSSLQVGPHGQAAWWDRFCGDSEQQAR